jgi:hypothetical protein
MAAVLGCCLLRKRNQQRCVVAVTAPFHRTERVLVGGMSYSLDLRKNVLVALEAESSSNVVAARFGVSGSFVRKLRARVRETGEPEAIPPPGKARIVDSKGEVIMRDLVDGRPDASQSDQRGQHVHYLSQRTRR